MDEFAKARPMSAGSKDLKIKDNPISAIEEAISKLDNELGRMKEIIFTLLTRLSPVLGPESPPNPNKEYNGDDNSGKLSDGIYNRATRVSKMANELEEIHSRLEL